MKKVLVQSLENTIATQQAIIEELTEVIQALRDAIASLRAQTCNVGQQEQNR
jgi:uncharacterized coiled-coil protein SlyX